MKITSSLTVLVLITISTPVNAQNTSTNTPVIISEDGLLDPTEEQKKLISPAASAPANASELIPENYTLRKYLPSAGYQGSKQGACSAFVVAYGIKTIQQNMKAGNAPSKDFAFSPAYVFNKAKQNKGDNQCNSGVTLIEALTALTNEGTVPNSVFKYQAFDVNGCNDPIPDNLKSSAKNYRISSFDAPELEKFEFKRLLSKGYPIAISVKVDDDFGKQGYSQTWTDKNPFVWKSYSSSNGTRKRHAMLCIGYNKELGFEIFNSWGNEFGQNGIFYIPYEFMFQATYDAYIAFDRQDSAKDAKIQPSGESMPLAPGLSVYEFDSWFKEGYSRS